MSPEPIVLLARQRSGTNAARLVLKTHSEIYDLGEVFDLGERHSEYELKRATNYFNFLTVYADGDLARVFPDRHAVVFSDFLAYLKAFTDKRYLIIDVKYSTLHLLHEPHASFGYPYLFNLIADHGLRVIQITRRNYLRYFLSVKKATASGVWQVEVGGEPVDEPILLDVPELIRSLERCEQEDRMVSDFLGHYGRFLSQEYAEMVTPGGAGLDMHFLERISAWLSIPNSFDNTLPILRQSYLPLPDAIENFHEVAMALQNTRFAHCLDDER